MTSLEGRTWVTWWVGGDEVGLHGAEGEVSVGRQGCSEEADGG